MAKESTREVEGMVRVGDEKKMSLNEQEVGANTSIVPADLLVFCLLRDLFNLWETISVVQRNSELRRDLFFENL